MGLLCDNTEMAFHELKCGYHTVYCNSEMAFHELKYGYRTVYCNTEMAFHELKYGNTVTLEWLFMNQSTVTVRYTV
jgi:hypothetical protein